MPAVIRNCALAIPADARAPLPGTAITIATSMLEHTWPTKREAGHSLSLGTGAEVLGPPPPKSGEGSGPGLASGGMLTSIGSSLQRNNGAKGTTPLRASSLLLKASTNGLLLTLI